MARIPASGRPGQGGVRAIATRVGNVAGLAAAVLLSWLAFIPRRLGDHVFTMNDNEAYWRGWQIAKVHGGLGRRYRDSHFDSLAECPKCQRAGDSAGPPCVPSWAPDASPPAG